MKESKLKNCLTILSCSVFWSDNGRSSLGSVRADGLNTKIKQLPEGSILTGIAVYKVDL